MRIFSATSFASVLLLVGATAFVGTAHADGLNGTSVSGALQVNSASGAVLLQQLNSPVVIGSGGMQVGSFSVLSGTQTFNFSANFSNSGLELAVTSPQSYANYQAFSGNLYTVLFSDAAFTGSFGAPTFSCSTDPYGLCAFTGNGLVASSLTGGNLSLEFQNAAAGQVYDFAYADAPAVTPEPASLLLAGTAMLGMAGTMRRRFAR